jgi:hypothetical protein
MRNVDNKDNLEQNISLRIVPSKMPEGFEIDFSHSTP